MNFTKTDLITYSVITSNVEKLDSSNSAELKAEFVLINQSSINNVILDLSHTKYCDSSGLSAVLIGNRLCKDFSGKLVINGLQANVEKLINISQLDKVFIISDNLEAAKNLI